MSRFKNLEPNIQLEEMSDKADNKFLELAVFAKADFLITGNINHFTFSEYNDIKIISPKDYFESYWKI